MAKKKTRWAKVGCKSDAEFLEACKNNAYHILMDGYFPYRSLVESMGISLMEWGLTPEETVEILSKTVDNLELDYQIVSENREDPIKAIRDIFARDGVEMSDEEIRDGIMKGMVQQAMSQLPTGEKH